MNMKGDKKRLDIIIRFSNFSSWNLEIYSQNYRVIRYYLKAIEKKRVRNGRNNITHCHESHPWGGIFEF